MSSSLWKFWIDTGGTFTDCLARDTEGRLRRAKVLSSSRIRGRVVSKISDRRLKIEVGETLGDGFFVGYRLRILAGEKFESEIVSWDAAEGVAEVSELAEGKFEAALCEFVSPEEPPLLAARLLTGKRLDEALPPMEMRLATTRGTNALLELKGARLGFFVTRGFGDLLKIGNQQRPNLFELGIQKPDSLAFKVCEVSGRLDAKGRELESLDEGEIRELAERSIREGVESFAVALLHAYRNPSQELRVAEILREAGANFVSVSSELAPFAKLLPRAETAVVDAYLSPIMDTYLDAVEGVLGGGANDQLAGSRGERAPTFFRVMTSAGGLVSRGQYRPKDSLLSGPAGGVVGSSRSGLQAGFARTIAFDMGGTSTDVSRFDGELDYRFEQRIGAARVFAPSLRIETVAAGGGSICWFDGAALRVGPESAGANPGPACYGAGGPLTVTDVNLMLGRLDASQFGIPVFPEASKKRLRGLQEEVRERAGRSLSDEETLRGLLAIADEAMAEAIRKISTSEGYDPSEYALVAFGGAGGLHACSIASILGMDTIVFPADAGLLSAYGLSQARMEQFAERQALQVLDGCLPHLGGWIELLGDDAKERLRRDGVPESEIELCPARYDLRYKGQESILVVEGGETEQLRDRFERAYEEQFGFLPERLEVELVAVRVVARSRVGALEKERFGEERVECGSERGRFMRRVSLSAGTAVTGPAVVQDSFSTIFVDTGWVGIVGDRGTLKLEKAEESKAAVKLSEVVELELFTNRFLSVVDEMGALLERAAFSTNVKDRKDFSCALLDTDGYLLANAPHIPVHLGALGVCLRSVLEVLELNPGDVVVTNHPGFGGSHLPDVTLLAPVYSDDGDELVGYVANRAHHAELGGISPGSMPPNARNLAEEGVVITPFKLVEGGKANWDAALDLLRGGEYPSRSVDENVADLSAQLASIRKGQSALLSLAAKEGVGRVKRFMGLLRVRAATVLSKALEDKLSTGRLSQMSYVERLDNGAPVQVAISGQPNGKWLVDFEGTAGEQSNNYNATPAIATSAVIYVLRLLAAVEVPLNEGFLDVVDIRIPEGMLNPRFDRDPRRCPAVVAGNVEVSQLVVSVLLKAFSLAACSQSTMNNFIFGTPRFGYYETIAGGEGATRERDGASGVHTHMTNTAMTDPEIMELRYPVRVERFSLREGSGGQGRKHGGDGVVKRIRFLEPVVLSLLTQRRVEPPFGMDGGKPGLRGEQFLELPDGERKALAGDGSWELEAGSVLEIRTPGGGGVGMVNCEW